MANTLLVTGANSYVAGPIIKLALERGYRVRGTVRSSASGENLLAVFPEYSAGPDARLVYDIVPNIASAENYAPSFAHGITGVVHTASPFALSVEDNTRDLLEPARDGAVAILDAAKKFGGGTVRSVISISSFAAVVDVMQGLRPGYVYTEADWNPISWTDAQKGNAVVAYCASKAHAEKAQWAWMSTHAQNVPFVLTTVTPPWIFGPYVDPGAMGITSASKLNESMKLLVRLVDGSLAGGSVPDTDFAGFIDVRDLAEIVIRVYEKSDDMTVAGQRFLAGSKFSYQSAVDVIREKFPELREKAPIGVTGAGLTEPTYVLDTSKIQTALGIKFTPLETTIVDSIQQIKQLL